MPIKTLFINLSPAAGQNYDQSGIINVSECKRLKVKNCVFQGTEVKSQLYIQSSLIPDSPLCTFSGRPDVYQNSSETIFDFRLPVSFSGTYDFRFFDATGAPVNLVGNVILHLEFTVA